jgi:hypothetical protein
MESRDSGPTCDASGGRLQRRVRIVIDVDGETPPNVAFIGCHGPKRASSVPRRPPATSRFDRGGLQRIACGDGISGHSRHDSSGGAQLQLGP